MIKFFKLGILILITPIILSSCKSPDGKFKLPGGDARKFPADPAKRVEQNLKQGKTYKPMDKDTIQIVKNILKKRLV